MSPRTLAIFFPDAEVQYWFTDRVFVVGDYLKRDGLDRHEHRRVRGGRQARIAHGASRRRLTATRRPAVNDR
jgi:hypothetical protein